MDIPNRTAEWLAKMGRALDITTQAGTSSSGTPGAWMFAGTERDLSVGKEKTPIDPTTTGCPPWPVPPPKSIEQQILDLLEELQGNNVGDVTDGWDPWTDTPPWHPGDLCEPPPCDVPPFNLGDLCEPPPVICGPPLTSEPPMICGPPLDDELW